MALFTANQIADLQSVVDLLLKGTAVEFPVTQDVADRLYQFWKTLGPTVSVTAPIEVSNLNVMLRDNPVTFLILLVLLGGAPKISNSDQLKLLSAVGLMLAGQARETPFAEDVIQRVAPVAQSTGFMSVGGFYEAIKDRPISTMVRWAIALAA